MPSVFQLGGTRADATPFARFGFSRNPFPEPGLDTGVYYTGHMQREIAEVNRWLQTVQNGQGPVRPLAVRGALGVGKTHLLKAIQSGLAETSGLSVLRKNLSEESMTRLLLSSLLLQSLPSGDGEMPEGMEPSTLPLLDKVIAHGRATRHNEIRVALETLGVESMLAAPVKLIIGREESRETAELRIWLARWIARAHTTPVQRNKLGLAGPLDGEGQAIRVATDLARLGRAAGEIKLWFVLIDQLEDLWREGVITPGRRARFLTDVRFLVDLALEGAPVAVLLAWNVAVAAREDLLKREYLALWRRLGDPVDIPGLPAEDVWPFAQAYIVAAPTTPKKTARPEFVERLRGEGKDTVLDRLASDPLAALGMQRFASYRVLHHWREVAEDLARAEEVR